MDNGDSTLGNRDLTVVAVALEPLENGTYTVAWKNVPTVEVHGVRGFASSVGEPISPVALEVPEQPLFQSPSEPWLRWLVLLSTLAVIGGFSFELLVWRPVLTRTDSTETLRGLGALLASRTLKLSWAAAAVFLMALSPDSAVLT